MNPWSDAPSSWRPSMSPARDRPSVFLTVSFTCSKVSMRSCLRSGFVCVFFVIYYNIVNNC